MQLGLYGGTRAPSPSVCGPISPPLSLHPLCLPPSRRAVSPVYPAPSCRAVRRARPLSCHVLDWCAESCDRHRWCALSVSSRYPLGFLSLFAPSNRRPCRLLDLCRIPGARVSWRVRGQRPADGGVGDRRLQGRRLQRERFRHEAHLPGARRGAQQDRPVRNSLTPMLPTAHPFSPFFFILLGCPDPTPQGGVQ